MKITFNRNVQFTKLIKVQGRLKEFNFRKANTNINGLFTIDVLDNEGPMGSRIIFQMERKDSSWQLVPKDLPKWITEKETELGEIIENVLIEISKE